MLLLIILNEFKR